MELGGRGSRVLEVDWRGRKIRCDEESDWGGGAVEEKGRTAAGFRAEAGDEGSERRACEGDSAMIVCRGIALVTMAVADEPTSLPHKTS